MFPSGFVLYLMVRGSLIGFCGIRFPGADAQSPGFEGDASVVDICSKLKGNELE